MGNLKIGDIVARKSYGCDILFKIVEIIDKDNEKIAILRGVDVRLQADSPESDLVLKS